MIKNYFSLILLAFTLITTTTYAQTVLAPEVLHYKFNESGTAVTNYASNPPVGTATATIMGGVTQNTVGSSCDGALVGSGISSSTDYLNTGWAPNIGTGAWSIVFTTSGISANSTLYYIFGDVNSNSFRCFTNGVAGDNNWIIRGGGLTDTYINGGALATETTCAFVYDPAMNNLKGYLNGVLVTTVAQTAPNISGTGPFKVMGYSSNVGAPAGGLMEEFSFYSRALTDIEVMQIYERQTTDTISVSSCGDYTAPSGAIFTSSGNYNDTIPNSICGDSIININLTINAPSFDTIQVQTCDSYIAPSGAVFTTSGIYNDTILNLAGCDSIITIDLLLNYSTADTLSVIECDSYDAPDGSQITSSGIYDFLLQNAAGCDSLIHVDLTINNSSSSSITETACFSFTAPDGAVYTQSGNYTAIIPNVAGCDSVISITLTINTINSQTTLNGLTITASETGATYQWIDCGTGLPIAGETQASFTATSNGSYAVEITKNGCVDTSACVSISNVGISEDLESFVAVYPNPVSDVLNIQTNGDQALIFVLSDGSGKEILSERSNDKELTLNMANLPSGIYSLVVTDANTSKTIKIVKL
jgi:hypothetical protein